MARSASSDAPDQRATEIASLRDLDAQRWREFSTGDFERASDPMAAPPDEDLTVPGRLLPPAAALRIVVGRPLRSSSEDSALREVLDVLGGALDGDPSLEKRPRLRRWLAIALIAGALATIPIELAISAAEQAWEWVAIAIGFYL